MTLAPQIGVDSFTATASRFNDGSLDKFFKQKFFFQTESSNAGISDAAVAASLALTSREERQGGRRPMRRRVIAFRPEFRIMFGILLRPDVAHPPSPSGHTALHHRVDLVRQLGEPLMQPPPEIDLNTSLLEGFSLTFG